MMMTVLQSTAVNRMYVMDSMNAMCIQRAWPSQPCRHLLREIFVYGILQPTLDVIADPDTINQLIITAVDSAQQGIEEEKVRNE